MSTCQVPIHEHWYADAGEVLAFARVLVASNMVKDVNDLLYYFEKPYKWSTERDLWKNLGKPDAVNFAAWMVDKSERQDV